MKKLNYIAVALLALSSISAQADDGSTFGRVGLGYSPLKDNVGTTQTIGVNIGGGKTFNKYLGVEGEIALLGMTGNLTAMPIDATLNGYLPIGEKTQLTGRAGFAYTFLLAGSGATSTSVSGVTQLWGVGIEIKGDAADKESYRLGFDHYGLGVAGGTLSSDYISLSHIEHF